MRQNSVVGSVLETLGFTPRKPRLNKFTCSARPTIKRQTIIRIGSQDAKSCYLTVRHEDGTVLFDGDGPTNGEVSIVPLNASRLTFRLRLDPRWADREHVQAATFEWTRLPRSERLMFWWTWVPMFGFVGKPICIRWSCLRAEWVDIICDDGYTPVAQKAGKSGVIMLYREIPGKVTIRLIARNAHGSVTEVRRLVRIFPMKPRIIVDRATQYVTPGNMVTFNWSANTPDVWLEAPSRNERHVLEQTGRFSMPMGDEPEEFFLKAQRLDRTCSVTLSAFPA